MQGKVEICGVNTSKLQTLSNAEMMRLIERSQQGDMDARSRLVEGNLKLVLSVVQRFLSRGENPDDLFQVGCIGLLKAIANFDTTKNVRFSTYGVPMIAGELRRYLRDYSPIRVSRSLRDRRQQLPDALSSLFQAAPLHPGAVVPAGALDAGRAVAELSKDHTPGNFAAALRIVSNAVLLPPEKHIAAALSAGPGQEAAPGRAEGQPDAPLGAGPHQRRRGPGIGKADNCLQRVQRIPGNHILFPVCQDIFPLQRQINVLRGDKQRVQKLLHGISSIAALR